MKTKQQFVVIAALLLIAHTIEEIAASFAISDPWSVTAAQLTHSNATAVYFAGQVVLFGLLGWLVFGRPKANGWYWLLGGILVFELDHVIRALQISGYYPGVITAILAVLFSIPYWQKILAKARS